MSKRKKITGDLKIRLLRMNAGVCCVCKTRGVGVNYHHIDHDPSNNDLANIAVLCVEDHDAHHRPQAYKTPKHIDLGPGEIRNKKIEWENFVAEGKTDHPRALAVINTYGEVDQIHSVRLIFQLVDGKIVHQKIYHLLGGPMESWVDQIMEEIKELAPNVSLTLLNEPLSIDYCPCCGSSVSNTLDRNVATKLTASDWVEQSVGVIYINPNQASLAITIGYKKQNIISASLHKCDKHLHFQTAKFEEKILIKKAPSVRTQATRVVQKFLKDWAPGQIFVVSGDHESPQMIDDFLLPKIWEKTS